MCNRLYTSLCTSLCSFLQYCEFRCAVLYHGKGEKIHIIIHPKVHFAMLYIFRFQIFEYTFWDFYVLLCLFVLLHMVWRIWKWNVSFFWGMQSLTVSHCTVTQTQAWVSNQNALLTGWLKTQVPGQHTRLCMQRVMWLHGLLSVTKIRDPAKFGRHRPWRRGDIMF